MIVQSFCSARNPSGFWIRREETKYIRIFALFVLLFSPLHRFSISFVEKHLVSHSRWEREKREREWGSNFWSLWALFLNGLHSSRRVLISPNLNSQYVLALRYPQQNNREFTIRDAEFDTETFKCHQIIFLPIFVGYSCYDVTVIVIVFQKKKLIDWSTRSQGFWRYSQYH